MCQYKSEGGRRCPVHRYDSMAAIKHVTKLTGLERPQVEKIFNELREEARSLGRGNADVASWNEYMASLEEEAQGQTVVVKNIMKAREGTNPPSKSTLYALKQLQSRAVQRRVALRQEFRNVSLVTGKGPDTVAAEFNSARKSTSASVTMSNADAMMLYKKNLPVDPKTAEAIKRVSEAARENTPRVQHQDVSATSKTLQSIGYDPDDGRLEVSFQRDPGTVYAYRKVPKEVWDSFSETGSMYIYANYIRNNERYTYPDAEAAHKDAYRLKCHACGQFRAQAHQCPEKAAQQAKRAVSATLTKNDEKAVRTGSVYAERWDVPASVVSDPISPSDEELYSYLSTRDVLSGVREVYTATDSKAAMAQMSQNGEVELPVRVNISGRITVEGTVTLTKDPEGLLDAVTVEHTLKCSCPEYQENYDCPHVRVLKDQGPAYLNHADDEYVNLEDSSQFAFESLCGDQIAEMEEIRDFALSKGMENEPYPLVVREYLNRFSTPVGFEEEDDDVEVAEDNEMFHLMVSNPKKARALIVKNRQATEFAKETAENEKNYRAYRHAMMERLAERDPGYQEDESKFIEHYQSALKEDIPYAYENVLDGACGDGPGARRFGVELEFQVAEGQDYATVMRNIGMEMHQAGLLPDPNQKKYHESLDKGYAHWSFEEDDSVDGEVISPLLDDSPESWRQLEMVCDIIRRNGGKVDVECGSHVHVSTGSYGLSTAKHGELQRSVVENEDVLYRAATNPFARSKRHRGILYCPPNVNEVEGSIEEDVEESHFAFTEGEDRSNLNMLASGVPDASKAHTEFRLLDGSLNPPTIQQQIKVAVAMVDSAERRVVMDGKSRERKKKENIRLGKTLQREREILAQAGVDKHTPETLAEVNRPVMKFLDETFRREEDRRSVLAVLARNSWQRL